MKNHSESIENRLAQVEQLLIDLKAYVHGQSTATLVAITEVGRAALAAANSNDSAANPGADRLMNVEEAANYLGLAVPTVYSLLQRRALPGSKRGKRWYFSLRELTEWAMAGRKKTIQEIEAEAEAYVLEVRKGGKR